MKDSLNSYLEEIPAYLKDNSLLISAPKSSVTLFTPDTHQAKTHPRILIEDSRLPLVQCPKILGVHMDTSLSFNKHSSHVAERVSGRNNILMALAAASWGQQKETLLMTYKAVGRSIINYAAPVWSTNLRDTNYRNIQYTQNEALRISTGCHKKCRSPARRSKHAESKGTLRATIRAVFGSLSVRECQLLHHHKGTP